MKILQGGLFIIIMLAMAGADSIIDMICKLLGV